MSRILASARARTSLLRLPLPPSRRLTSSSISFSVKPRSWARLMKRMMGTVSSGYSRYPDGRRSGSALRACASPEPVAGGAGTQRTCHGAQKPCEQSAGGEVGALQEDGGRDKHEEEPARDEDASRPDVPAPARAGGEEQQRDGRVDRPHGEEERSQARSEARGAPLHDRRQRQQVVAHQEQSSGSQRAEHEMAELWVRAPAAQQGPE